MLNPDFRVLRRFITRGSRFKAMPTAFVLVNTEIGCEEEILEELKKIPNVKEAYAVYGVYDIIAKVEANTMDELKEVISWRIALRA